ncbi:MAG: hypothetical protein IT318_23855 [Anaerolineales bacterium]|nr:hypothetical protein [Anaerolineales bacterium]
MNLQWPVMWCDRHLRPLKAEWPRGAALAMLGLFNAAMASDDIMRRAGGKIVNVPLVLNSIKPVCCFLGDAVAAEVIRLALAGEVYGQTPASGLETGENSPAP